ncbi:Rhodanese-like protein [Exidia glandulosa HHB12029]|uniref:Rhodanese-like protein n=1 Tax=Exidia glandulosa HHB12029 TaxID=1314781 RepID=A0A165PBZ7_EXIGL|nr:Rhodanese-like protein [Exidia glandulosa HHB12029]
MFSLAARRIIASTRVTITRSLHAAARPQMLHPAPRPLVARRFEHTTAPGQTLQERANFQGDWIAPVVPYERVKALTEQPNENVYLIDVREPEEVAQGAIPSAVSIPLSGFAQSIKLDEAEFKEKHGFNKPALDKEVIFYCRSGKRSASASDIARRNGYKNVLNYEGSWLDWTARQGTPGAGAS